MTPQVPVEGNDSLRDLLDQLRQAEQVSLTEDGKQVGVLLSREQYNQLLIATSTEDRQRLTEIVETNRREVADTGLDQSVVDEAVEAARTNER